MSMITQSYSTARRNGRPAKAELIARVQALLPDVPSGSPRLQTALLYLASRWTPNIDRLAAFAACDREFVAVRARRWVDHGLWVGSRSGEGEVGREQLLHAIVAGEGLAPQPVLIPLEEEAPLPSPTQEPEIHSDWHASEFRPRADALEESHNRFSAVDPADSEPVPEQDSDTLLADLWSRLGLSPTTAIPERRAA